MNGTMKGMVLAGHGGLEMLQWREDLPMPVAGINEVLIKVSACGLNNTDINTRLAWYSKAVEGSTTEQDNSTGSQDDAAWGGNPITFPRIQGADVVGTVVSAGSESPSSLVGERVMIDPWQRDQENPFGFEGIGYLGSEFDGGFAEYLKVDFRSVHPVSSTLSDAELATFATSYVTAENMLNKVEVNTDDSVLVTGASGGVGSALIQLAGRRGARTIALSSGKKLELVDALNPDALIDRDEPNLVRTISRATGTGEVTVVADVVGGPMWPTLIDVIARGGRYVCSGAVAGPIVEFDLRTFYLRDLTFKGATVVPPGTFADLVKYIERNEIRPLLAATFNLRDLRSAQTAFLARKHLGNIVVIV